MGTNTTFLDLYKPNEAELVDVEDQLNSNYDKIDVCAEDHESRITAIEAVAGGVSWTDYVPVIADNTNNFVQTLQTARFSKIGNVVTLEIAAELEDWSTHTSAPKVPLPWRSIAPSGANHILNSTAVIFDLDGSTLKHLTCFILGTNTTTRSFLQTAFLSSITHASGDPSDTLPLPSSGAYLKLRTEYITDGTLLV